MIFEYTGDKLTLDISLKSGDMSFQPEERSDIEVEFPDLRKNAADEKFDVTLEDGILKIKEKKSEKASRGISFMIRNGGDVIIRYPKNILFDGSIITYSGDLEAKSFNFSGKCKTYSGDVVIDILKTEMFKLEAYSGDVKIGMLDGALTLNSYSGDVVIKDGTITALDLNSYSGDCGIEGSFALTADGTIKSLSGDVKLMIKEYTGDATLFIQSLSGDTNVKGVYPEDKVVVKSLMKSMNFNPVKFFSGSSQEDVEVEVDSTKKHVQRVIDMIDSGKITPEEGEKLIKAVKG